MADIRIIGEDCREDINLPNEPFRLIGRMIPSYTNGRWSYDVCRRKEEDITEMRFPDENYRYDEMKDDSVFIGAYDQDRCVGLAVLRDACFRYMYLYDLKTSREYRRQGVATALLEKAKEACRARGYSGIYTIGQDDNLSACLFYIKAGFCIGGFDTRVYHGTAQEGKADVIFYLDC